MYYILLLGYLMLFAGEDQGIQSKKELLHPFHVSATEIEYNEAEKLLEISCRMFTDDFEAILYQKYKKKADFSKPELLSQMNTMVANYITDNLGVNINKKSVTLQYLGFEKDHEAIYVYLEVPEVTNPREFKIKNTLLYDLFDDQIGIIHLKAWGKRVSDKLEWPESMMTINF